MAVNGWLAGGVGGYVAGGGLALLGAFLAVTQQRGGRQVVRCPGCHEIGASLAPAGSSVVPCPICQRYLRLDTDGVSLLAEDEVAPFPIFEAPLPEGEPTWPRGCCLCGAVPCEEEEVLGWRRVGLSVWRGRVSVPVCVHHRGARAVTLGRAWHRPGRAGVALYFRSHAVARYFREVNAPERSGELRRPAILQREPRERERRSAG